MKHNIKRCDLKMEFANVKVGITMVKIQYKNTTLNIVFDITLGPCTEELTSRTIGLKCGTSAHLRFSEEYSSTIVPLDL
jgi:hypothetical protein